MRIKHPPPKSSSTSPTTVYLATKTPFVSAVKRVIRNLERTQRKRLGRYVTVYGLGKAIQRTLAVAMQLQVEGYTVEVRTLSLKALDEEANEQTAEVAYVPRPVGAIELRVHPKTPS